MGRHTSSKIEIVIDAAIDHSHFVSTKHSQSYSMNIYPMLHTVCVTEGHIHLSSHGQHTLYMDAKLCTAY